MAKAATNTESNTSLDRIIGIGDSIMIGKHSGYQGFLYQACLAMSGFDTKQHAESGSYIQFLWNSRNVIKTLVNQNAPRNVILINTCTNNINNAGGNWTTFASLLLGHLDQLVADLEAYHPSVRVVVNTVIARKFAGGANVQIAREKIRLEYNDLLRASNHALADIADLPGFQAADAYGTPSDLSLYVPADKTHLLASGYVYAAPVVNAALSNALA